MATTRLLTPVIFDAFDAFDPFDPFLLLTPA